MNEEKNLTLEKAFNLALQNPQNNLEVAENLCKDILKKESNHFKANFFLGILSAINKKFDVAKQAKLPYSKPRLTKDPEYNINLGSHYIAGLILEYEGSYPFAIGAYNAGPKRIRYWKKVNKNPQKNQIDYVDWIELIKFKETRNYVQRVLENYNVYRYILEKKPIRMKDFLKDQPLY